MIFQTQSFNLSLIFLLSILFVVIADYDISVSFDGAPGYELPDTRCVSDPTSCTATPGGSIKPVFRERVYLATYYEPGCNPGSCAGYYILPIQQLRGKSRTFNLTIPTVDKNGNYERKDGPYPSAARWIDGDTLNEQGCPPNHL